VWHPQQAAFDAEIPIILAVINLAEGPQMVSSVVNCLTEDVRIEMDVQVVFEEIADQIALPKFEPVA
jgi:uncharacterized OB-fold protein